LATGSWTASKGSLKELSKQVEVPIYAPVAEWSAAGPFVRLSIPIE
jgi:hypothetical protein